MKGYDIGVYGLGVMGSAIAKNIINNGFKTILFSINKNEMDNFNSDKDCWKCAKNVEEFINSLEKPRKIFLMITSGSAVDSVIESITPFLDKNDIIIDGGNSYYKDTVLRYEKLQEKGIKYVGAGVSGGEKGALLGPSIMIGCDEEPWQEIKPIFEKIAAKYDGEPCCGRVGGDGAGHYVKMVHNGIEYAILQQIADICHIMKEGLGLSFDKMAETFEGWKNSQLESYLIDITVDVLRKKDDDGKALVEKILDSAKMKGTGTWTVKEGLERGVYIPCINEAVGSRILSQNKSLRTKGAQKLSFSSIKMNMPNFDEILKNTLFGAIICSYAQGLELISKASEEFGWNIDIAKVSRLWRDGCIIRSSLLEDIACAYTNEPYAQNLILTEDFSFMEDIEPYLRHTAVSAVAAGVFVPGILSAVSYYDGCRCENMPVNIIQGLRDCFGAHTYQRIDREGIFHSKWN